MEAASSSKLVVLRHHILQTYRDAERVHRSALRVLICAMSVTCQINPRPTNFFHGAEPATFHLATRMQKVPPTISWLLSGVRAISLLVVLFFRRCSVSRTITIYRTHHLESSAGIQQVVGLGRQNSVRILRPGHKGALSAFSYWSI
jgi:hypothetical protein